MERTYESAAALVERATDPLAPHLGLFVTSLISQQYAASVIYIKALHALAFDRWVAKRRVVLADLGEAYAERYQHRSRRRHQRIRSETRHREWCDVKQLLQFLRSQGLCPTIRVATTAADDLVARYQHPSTESPDDTDPMTSFSPSSITSENTDYVPHAHPVRLHDGQHSYTTGHSPAREIVQFFMSEQDLDGADVFPLLEQMRGERVPQRMHADALVDVSGLRRLVHRAVQLPGA
jgi:hypothetical protein